jgi:tetratricopeptide (TPR) repeat protein
MNKSVRVLALVAVALSLFSAVGCSKLRARDQLNKGVQAYKNQKFETAIGMFQKAVELDPTLINARLYLATAYAQQYVPGADTKENLTFANQAISEYDKVLQQDPKNISSIKGIAFLYLNMKNWDKAKEYYRKAIAVDSNDPEAYYSVAVIDWTQSYKQRMDERSKLGMAPTDQLKDKKVCEKLRESNMGLIDEGKQMLEQALKIRPDYDDAMAYLNLMYREEADLDCTDPAARAAALKTADEWVDKTMATKKAKADKQGPGGIVIPESGSDQKQ